MKFKKVKTLKVNDLLYDFNLKQFCSVPKFIDIKTLDMEYIKKFCKKVIIK